MTPYVYQAIVHRVIDGDSVKLHLDLGFGLWWLATVSPLSTKEAPYPQGVYRLLGIDTPEVHGAEKEAGLFATERVRSLLALSNNGDKILVQSHKERVHGKFRYMLDLYVPVEGTPLGFDGEVENEAWLTDDDLQDLIDQTKPGASSTVRAMATEILSRRRAAGSTIHVNQQLIDEGLAKPYDGGKK